MVILDFGSLTRRRLLVDHVRPADTLGVGKRGGVRRGKAQRGQRVQDHKGGVRRQRDHQPVGGGEVIGP